MLLLEVLVLRFLLEDATLLILVLRSLFLVAVVVVVLVPYCWNQNVVESIITKEASMIVTAEQGNGPKQRRTRRMIMMMPTEIQVW
ncbi:hypothetical protein HYC85_000671 [Camellia sinensis]|uniref:Uncharacterized protein n=1 Tax=Camellia sinensis TaxID=4442 RepID=A0A7J7I354_CAMSI|nr:hypothetical protein HYC85_000671 [Camellia sinensis]